VVVEEYIDGPEVSLFVLCDGESVVPLAPAQDFKRVGDGDTGPNTGGMGAYSPLPWAPAHLVDNVVDRVALPVVREMAHRGTPFSGVLYCGLALTARGLRVVEFNVRFGDPETQSVLARLATPLGGVLLAAADYRWQLASLGHRWLEWALDNRTLPALGVGRPRSHLGVWLAVGCVGAWSHLPADMAFSGNADFGDWPLRLWWPFSDRAYSFPLVPWGDVGVSVIFALGIIAMLRWRMRVQLLSAITLATVLVYIVCRGPVGNTLMLN
jgi:hypothetical protein